MNIQELTKEEFEQFPVYQGKYLHISSLLEEKVSYEGETYLAMYSMATSNMWVSKSTVIAHMVGYYDINETGKPVDSAEWKISDGHTVLAKDRNRFTSQTLPKGAKYILVRPAVVVGGCFDTGTLAVRYPDVTYPSV